MLAMATDTTATKELAEQASATRAVFLDRDGVLNRRAAGKGYVRSWAEFEFLPGAVEALAHLCRQGALPIVVTNQRGVARGLLTADDLADIHRRMAQTLTRNGVRLGGVYVCPHEADTCACRKPAVGLFLQAQRDHPQVLLADADMVGDSLSDLQAGHRLGMRVWLVGEPQERAQVAAEATRRGISLSGSAGCLADLVRAGELTGMGVAA